MYFCHSLHVYFGIRCRLDVSIGSCDLVGYYMYYILLVYDHLYPLQDCVCSNSFASAEPIFNPNICVIRYLAVCKCMHVCGCVQ